METEEVIIHPDSFRGLAYEVQNQLYGAGATDDSQITIYQIEAELKRQYGLLLDQDDQKRQKLGQRPDPSRLSVIPLVFDDSQCAECDKFLRVAAISDLLSWNGRPYITAVESCGIKYTPVSSSWQLVNVSERSSRPTYTIEGETLKAHNIPRTVAVDKVNVTCITKDPMGGLDRNDPALWQRAWIVSEAYKAQIKERAEIRLRGGSVATWMRSDKTNNGVENGVPTQK